MRHLIAPITGTQAKTMCNLTITAGLEITMFDSRCDCDECHANQQLLDDIDADTDLALRRLKTQQIRTLGGRRAS